MYFKRGTAKASDAEGTRFATVPQIGISGVPQIRVVSNHTHFRAIQE